MKRAYRNRDLIKTLDPDEDYLRIYQLTTLYDFPTDMRVGLNLAFYRIFAIPHMAELLVQSGEIHNRPKKRAYDTGLIMYEIIANGFDHPRSREMIRLLNRIHKPWPISNDDYRYVLAALMVVPLQWLDRRGWRPLLASERDASVNFYLQVGRLMAIKDAPTSYADAARLVQDFERRNLRASPAGRRLMESTQQIIVRKLPGPAKRFGPALTSALFDQPELTDALGLPAPSWPLARLVDGVFLTRKAFRRLRPASAESWFEPGRSAGSVYPQGYSLHQLGPQTQCADESAQAKEPSATVE
jgi:hypothetical protein